MTSIFQPALPGAQSDAADTTEYVMGTGFVALVDGTVEGVWFYGPAGQAPQNVATFAVGLTDITAGVGSGTVVYSEAATPPAAGAGWTYYPFATPQAVTLGRTYQAVVRTDRYTATASVFTSANGDYDVPAGSPEIRGYVNDDGAGFPNGSFRDSGLPPTGIAIPAGQFNQSFYGIDVEFTADGGGGPTGQTDFDAPAGARRTIAEEVALGGAPDAQWTVSSSAGDPTRPGFAVPWELPDASAELDVDRTVEFKIDSTDGDTIDIYRLGYYAGDLTARRVATLPYTPTTQPAPTVIPNSNGALDFSGWTVNAQYVLPRFSTPGRYLAVVRNAAGNNAFHIDFNVSDPGRTADIVVQRSCMTHMLAYNYAGNPVAGELLLGDSWYGSDGPLGDITLRVHAATYQRPQIVRDGVPQTSQWGSEIAFIRWAERQGYELSYITNRGVHDGRLPALLAGSGAGIFVSLGHDEYWTQEVRDAIVAARDAGVHLVFATANEGFWRVRADGADPDLFWCYKDTMPGPGAHVAGDPLDPVTWTGTWRDLRRPTPPGSEPESDVTGSVFVMNGIRDENATIVAATYGLHPLWRGTTVDTSGEGGADLLLVDVIGFEADAFVPPVPEDRWALAGATTINISGSFTDDNGQIYNLTDADIPGPSNGTVVPEPASGDADLEWGILCHWYPASSSLVVDFGTNQWPWMLDAVHDRGTDVSDLQAQQATVNLLADLGATPTTLETGLVQPTPVAASLHAGVEETTPGGGIELPAAQPDVTVAVSIPSDAAVSPALVRRRADSSGPLRVTLSRSDAADLDVGTTEMCVVAYTAEPSETDWFDVVPDETGTDAVVGFVLGPVGSSSDVERGPGRYRLGLRSVIGGYRQVWFVNLSLY